jgi:serine/threonine protein kinase
MNINLDDEKYSNLEPEALNLLKKMLVSNPSERITAAQTLNLPYFTKMREAM